jgi:hypothetical protein
MDGYAERFAELADRVWQNEYTNGQVEPEIRKTERSTSSWPFDGVQWDSKGAA